MAAMSSFKTIKSLSKPLLHPPVLATLLSIGVHGVFAITLPFLPANSKSTPDSPRSVALIELTPTEQSRLPDFSIPQIILPNQPSSLLSQQPQVPKNSLGGIPNCPDGQMLELSQGTCVSVPGQSTLPLPPPTDPSFTNPNFPPPPPISYYPISPIAQQAPQPPPSQKTPQQSIPIPPTPKLPAGSAALINPLPNSVPSTAAPNTPGSGTPSSVQASDGGNPGTAVAPTVSPATPAPRVAVLLEEQKQLREIYAREAIGTTSEEAYAKLDSFTEWWKQVNANPADPKSPTKTVKFSPRYPTQACTKRSKGPVKGTVRVAALISPEGKVVDEPIIVQRSNFKILNQAASETIADIRSRSYDPLGGYQVYIFDLEFNGENCANASS